MMQFVCVVQSMQKLWLEHNGPIALNRHLEIPLILIAH